MQQGLDSKITTRQVNIEYKVNGRDNCPGYLSTENKDSKQGLVLIQEWWGVNQSICGTADKFAKAGFRVLIPDVYRGKVAKDTEEAGHLLNGLDWPGAVADVGAACQYLKDQGCQKVGILGFCMGGALTIAALSAHGSAFSAGAPYYGICDLNSFPLKNIKAPVLAHFGEKDELKGFSDPESARNLQKQGEEAGLDIKVVIWPEAGHAFMNIDRPDAYHKQTAEGSMEQTVAFFKKHLE